MQVNMNPILRNNVNFFRLERLPSSKVKQVSQQETRMTNIYKINFIKSIM